MLAELKPYAEALTKARDELMAQLREAYKRPDERAAIEEIVLGWEQIKVEEKRGGRIRS